MNEQEFKKMFERYAESMLMEIWKPIEDKINKTLELTIEKTHLFEHKLKLVCNRQLRIRKEFTALHSEITNSIKDIKADIDGQNYSNKHIEKKILDKVNARLALAIEYGKKSEELYLRNVPDFQGMVAKAKADIKNECDLRIMDILKLEQRYRALLEEGKESPIIIK